MESFNDFYDIESPRTSERKIETIENSIHHSLLYNNQTANNLNIYSYLLKILLWIMVVGVISCIILVVLLVMKNLS